MILILSIIRNTKDRERQWSYILHHIVLIHGCHYFFPSEETVRFFIGNYVRLHILNILGNLVGFIVYVSLHPHSPYFTPLVSYQYSNVGQNN